MMKEMDARLDQKVAAMEAATGEKKVDAMEAVIKEMVAQRKEMQEQMKQIREKWAEYRKSNAKKGEDPKEGETGED
jgi:L-fucose mutarotase/ribose pyranase (RbsD/FucU family)